MTPAEIALVVSVIQWAISAGKDIYDAAQLKAMADLVAKLQGSLTNVRDDRKTANADIDAHDNALEDKLAGK